MKNVKTNIISGIKTIGKGAVTVGGTLGAVLIETLDAYAEECKINESINGYSDAISAITKANMWSADKKALIGLLKKDGDAGYYKSVINIVDSAMWSSDKIDAIKKM